MKEKHPIVKFIAKLIFQIGRIILSVRYKVQFSNLEKIDPNKPVLFLPNHQAVVDPMILVSFIYPKKNVVPVITSTYYDLPILNKFFKNWGAVRVSDLEKGSRNTNVLNDITNSAKTAFNNKKSLVIYPAGQIAGQGFEKILNKKGAFEIVKSLPEDVQIIGVRISGLWGSMLSKAWTGKSPNFVAKVFKGFFYAFVNLLLFMPKRKVSIHVDDLTKELKEKAKEDKQVFNASLEKFYNANGEEEVKFIKHYFYGTKLKRKLPKEIEGSIKYIKEANSNTQNNFPNAVILGVSKIVSQQLQINIGEIKPQSHLINELGADSISIVNIVSDIEKEFKIENYSEIAELKTIRDLNMLANGNLQKKNHLPPSTFIKSNPFNDFIKIPYGDNIPQLFIKRFTSRPYIPFSYDAMLGETTRKGFLLKVCVIAEIIKNKNKGERVGIMLPALQSTSMIIMATYLAGKIPVMLNWTVGKKVLSFCVEEAKVDSIFSASTFVNKVKDQLPNDVINKIVYMDKEVPALGLLSKLKGLLKSKFPNKLISIKNTSDTAVILFTSGSENQPKAVPLTHKNILSDLKGTLELVDLERNRVLMAFLPPFHSFGFTVLSILPMITGTRVVYSPDPTDGRAIVQLIKHTSASLLISAPSFLNMIMNNAVADDLKSIKYVVSGAEALSENILKNFKNYMPEAILIEGYGITECAPILSLNPLQKQKIGSVGKVIKGVDCLIIDIENKKPLKNKKEGLICFKGENVFSGYLNKNIPSPFINIEDNTYYNTGDLGYIDDEGYLYITGRLKRFIKIAGEMVSLPLVENILLKKYGSEEEKVLAVEGTDKTTPPQIVLFATKEINIKEANEYLRENNAPPIAKITRVEQLEEIPLLGTGKVDYKVLKEALQ